MVHENISVSQSSCLYHLLRLAQCHQGVKAESLYTWPLEMDSDSFRGTLTAVLYHYTSLEGLLGILDIKSSQPQSIWATNIFYLNDASELNYSIKLIKNEINFYVTILHPLV